MSLIEFSFELSRMEQLQHNPTLTNRHNLINETQHLSFVSAKMDVKESLPK